jgi:hypothetical protein
MANLEHPIYAALRMLHWFATWYDTSDKDHDALQDDPGGPFYLVATFLLNYNYFVDYTIYYQDQCQAQYLFNCQTVETSTIGVLSSFCLYGCEKMQNDIDVYLYMGIGDHWSGVWTC